MVVMGSPRPHLSDRFLLLDFSSSPITVFLLLPDPPSILIIRSDHFHPMSLVPSPPGGPFPPLTLFNSFLASSVSKEEVRASELNLEILNC